MKQLSESKSTQDADADSDSILPTQISTRTVLSKLLATASASASDSDLSDSTECSYPSLFPRILSGSIGSIVTALAVTPLEVVKIRQQTTATTKVARSACPSCGTFILNNGLMECIVKDRKSVV